MRRRQVALVHSGHHLDVVPAGDVTDHRHHAGAAVREPAEVEHVVTGVEGQPRALHEADAAEQVTDGVLDRDDQLVLGRPREGVLGDRDAGPPRDVVEHHREVGGICHGAEVREQAVLGGLAVVGRDDEDAVRPDLAGLLRELDRVGGVVGADPGDHGRPVAHRLDDRAEDGAVLLRGRGRRLTGGPRDHDAVVAVLDEVLGDPRGAVQVDGPVLVERRDHCREDAPERPARRLGSSHTVSV